MSLSTEHAPDRLVFAYRALRADGSEQIGEVTAASRGAARDQLSMTGIFPVEVRPLIDLIGARRTIATDDLALGLRLMSSLLAAGLPLERALGILPHVAPRGWDDARLSSIRGAVREGASLSKAFRQSGLGMPTYVLGMIDAGESAGTLVEALREVATTMEAAARHRTAVRSALAYPAILAIAGILAIGLLTGIVLPRFAELLADVGQELPFSARLLLSGAHLVERWWVLLLLGPVVAAAWFTHRVTSDAVTRRRLHAWLLVLPVVGPMRQALAGARITAALASMLGTGVPLAVALTHTAQAAGDEEVASRVLAAREGVIRGERLSAALGDAAVVRPGVLQLVRAGEATGEVGEMLRTAARIETEWSMARMRATTTLIEPSLILGFGSIIAFVAAALLQAVYAIRPTP